MTVHVPRHLAVCLLALVVASALAAPARAGRGAVATYVEGSAATPFSLTPPVDQALSLGAPGDQALSLATPVLGELPFTAVATSRALDLGAPAQDKEFLALAWLATKQRATVLFVSYSVDGGAWLPAVGGTGYDIPRGTHGLTIAYRITLTTGDAAATPVVDEIAVEWTRWSGRPTDPPPGDGGGTSHRPGADAKPGSGSYTYPEARPGGPSASGGPSGAGDASGSGSAQGGGSSGSSGGSGSGSGASSSTVANGTAAEPQPQTPVVSAVTVPSPPVGSTAVGAAQMVSGLPVDETTVISGVPFEPAGGAGLEAGNVTLAAPGNRRFPYAPVAAVTGGLAVLLLVPCAVMAANLRRITGADMENARLFGPFWPLRP